MCAPPAAGCQPCSFVGMQGSLTALVVVTDATLVAPGKQPPNTDAVSACYSLPAAYTPPLSAAVMCYAGMRDPRVLRGVNELATARFMHVIAPHPDTGRCPACWWHGCARCVAVLLLLWVLEVGQGCCRHHTAKPPTSLCFDGKHQEVLQLLWAWVQSGSLVGAQADLCHNTPAPLCRQAPRGAAAGHGCADAADGAAHGGGGCGRCRKHQDVSV